MAQEQPTLAEQLKAIRAQSLNNHVAMTQLCDTVEAQVKEIERLTALVPKVEFAAD